MAFVSSPNILLPSKNNRLPSVCSCHHHHTRTSPITSRLTPNVSLVTATATLLTAAHLLTNTPSFAEVSLSPASDSATTQQANDTDTSVVPSESNVLSEKELLEQTRKNTRLAGRQSQQFSTARRLAEDGDIDGALTAYNELIKEAPNFAPAYSNRANILVSKNQLTKAIEDYNQAIQLAPLDGDTWVVHVNRAVALLVLPSSSPEQIESTAREALADFNTAYNRKGADPLVLQNRAAAYEVLGKWDSAIRDYQAALSKEGNKVQPFWLRYGLVLFERGKDVESIAVMKRVANAFNVDDVKAAMAAIYFEDGYLAQAESLWSSMERPRQFESRKFLESRKWPPRIMTAMDHFRKLKD